MQNVLLRISVGLYMKEKNKSLDNKSVNSTLAAVDQDFQLVSYKKKPPPTVGQENQTL